MSIEPMPPGNSQFRGSATASDPSGTMPASVGKIRHSQEMPGSSIERRSQGRRELRLSIGSMHVQVVEILADELTDEERRTIQRARESYASMWGQGDGSIGSIKEDLFDGRSLQRVPYTVWHYIATVTSAGEEDKMITMRKVYYPLQSYYEREKMEAEEVLHWVEEHLPDEISFWEIVNKETNTVRLLWEELKARESKRIFDFCALSRTGIIPYVIASKDERTREKSGVAFAAIQLLAAHRSTGDFMFAQQCEELPKKALQIVDTRGQDVVLDFSPATHTFGLTVHQVLRLNRGHPPVIQHLASFPGYWVDNALAAATVTRLVKEGKVSEEIQRAWERLRGDALTKEEVMRKLLKDVQSDVAIFSESDLPTDIENVAEQIVVLLTKPRYFKYLLPLEEHTALYHGIVYESGDGPFLAALRPETWEKSAQHLLRKAQEKYRMEPL